VVEIAILKISPAVYRMLGIYLPLITTNCAVLGVAVLNSNMFFGEEMSGVYSFLSALTQGIFSGVGFMLAMLLMSGIRERLELADVPESFKGIAIAFVVASLMSMSFMGFTGFKF
jgi:electron transport complex protein RnfA